MLLKQLDSYTSVIKNLRTLPGFEIIHLEVLLLHKCKGFPNSIKTGMAVGKCSTVCIKELSKFMILTKEWKLVETLIEHGTIPDVKCIETAIEQYTEQRTLFLTQEIEKAQQAEKADYNIGYDRLLSMAIHKKWCGKFVQHCLKKGAKFAAKDIWAILQWKSNSEKYILFESIVAQDGAVDVQNDKGQSPLDFLLEQGMFHCALTLLKFNIDTSRVDLINAIKTLKKYDTSKHSIITLLNGIVKNKRLPPDLLEKELISAFKCAFSNNRYDMAVVLINHGLNINLCVEKSTTVVHIATKIALHMKGSIITLIMLCITEVCTSSK